MTVFMSIVFLLALVVSKTVREIAWWLLPKLLMLMLTVMVLVLTAGKCSPKGERRGKHKPRDYVWRPYGARWK
jgi:branched-subunit amino acid permease